MRAGFGIFEITPPLGVELAGYGYYLKRTADRVEDPLFARAVALENNEETFLLVSCDCLGLSQEIVDQVRERIKEKYDIPGERMMIVSIHTHTGPAMKYHEGCGDVSPEYTAGVPDKIMLACENALNDLKEVERLEPCGRSGKGLLSEKKQCSHHHFGFLRLSRCMPRRCQSYFR